MATLVVAIGATTLARALRVRIVARCRFEIAVSFPRARFLRVLLIVLIACLFCDMLVQFCDGEELFVARRAFGLFAVFTIPMRIALSDYFAGEIAFWATVGIVYGIFACTLRAPHAIESILASFFLIFLCRLFPICSRLALTFMRMGA